MKTIKGTDTEWLAESVKFKYKGKSYNVPIDSHFVLQDFGMTELKNTLNELPGRLAYWKALQVQVDRELSDMKDDFDIWYQKKYMEIDQESDKKTETWKKAKVLLDNSAEHLARKTAIKDMEDVSKCINVIVHSYSTMIWTLREITRLTGLELGSITNAMEE